MRVLGHTEIQHVFLGAVEQAVGVLDADDARRQCALKTSIGTVLMPTLLTMTRSSGAGARPARIHRFTSPSE